MGALVIFKRLVGQGSRRLSPTRFVLYGNPSDKVRAGLVDLNPTYMKLAGGFSR